MSHAGGGEAAEDTPSPHGGHLKDSTLNQLEVAVFSSNTGPNCDHFSLGKSLLWDPCLNHLGELPHLYPKNNQNYYVKDLNCFA